MTASPNDPDSAQNDSLLVNFTGMAYGGDAVGRWGAEPGIAVFAWPGISGERARVQVTSRRSNLLRGAITQVLEPSPLRVEPHCPYFGPCGGCQWQHIEYEGQVNFKHDILRSQLNRIAGLPDVDGVLRPPLQSPSPFNYRNTSHFAIAPDTRSLGYFKRDTHTVIPVDDCPISNRGINATLPIVNGMLGEAPTEGVLHEGARGVMRVWQVTIRSSEKTGHTVVIFHTRAGGPLISRHPKGRRRAHARPEESPGFEANHESNPDIPLIRRQVRQAISRLYRQAEGEDPISLTVVEAMEDGTINMLGATRAASVQTNDAVADALSGSSLKQSLSGALGSEAGPPLGSWVERLGGRDYWVAPGAFFQANTGAAELLLSEVASHIPQKLSLVVDAHAGVGTFAMALGGRAGRVVCFEQAGSAVAGGRWTASLCGISNVEFRQGRAETLLPRLSHSEQPDLILLDPPRSGCHPDLLAEVLLRRIPRIVYVSCDPSTLARDIKTLSASYTLTSARLIDMFPQTFHLETVAVLECSLPNIHAYGIIPGGAA